MPLSLSMTLSFIGKRFEVIHVNQDKTKTSMTKPMPSPKQVHYTESPGHCKPSLPTTHPSVAAITRRQHATGVQTPTSSHIAISPQFAANDLLTLQHADRTLRTIATHISDPLTHPVSTSDLATFSELRTLHSIKHMLHLRDVCSRMSLSP